MERAKKWPEWPRTQSPFASSLYASANWRQQVDFHQEAKDMPEGRGPKAVRAINRKSLSLIIWPKRWQAWLTLIFGQNTRPGSKEKHSNRKKNKSTRRDRSSTNF